MKTVIKNGTNLIVSTAKASHNHSHSHSHHSFGEVGSPKPPSPLMPSIPSPGQTFVPKRLASPSLPVPPHQMPRRSLTSTPPPPFHLSASASGSHLSPTPGPQYWARKSPAESVRTTPDLSETKTAVRLPPVFDLDTCEVDHNFHPKTESVQVEVVQVEVVQVEVVQVEVVQPEASAVPITKSAPKLSAAEMELAAKHSAPRYLRLDGGLYFSAKHPDPLAKDFLAKRGVGIDVDPATGSPILVDKFAQGLDKFKLNAHNTDISEESVRQFVEQSQSYHGAKLGLKY